MWSLRKKPLTYYEERSEEISEDEQKWEVERKNLQRQKKIKTEYNIIMNIKEKKRLTMSKLALLFLFITCTTIIIFTGWVTIQSIKISTIMGFPPDFTPLITLIGAVISETIGIAVYYIKSSKENTSGGIIYERAAFHNFQNQPNESYIDTFDCVINEDGLSNQEKDTL